MDKGEFFAVLEEEGVPYKRISVPSDILGDTEVAEFTLGKFLKRVLWPRYTESPGMLRAIVREQIKPRMQFLY